MPAVAIIGGSGLDSLGALRVLDAELISTPYGNPSGPVLHGILGGQSVRFLARHGADHGIPPHCINYRANLWALHYLGVDHVLAVAAVGAIESSLRSASLAVPDQIIDYTWGRESTFHDGKDGRATHVEFTRPYCEALRRHLLRAARECGYSVPDQCTYAATQGPRFETAAEIDRLERDGAGIVGMTGMPEAVLARELGICYATLAVVANAAAGRGSVDISMEEIERTLAEGVMKAVRVLESTVGMIIAGHDRKDCG